MALLAHVARKLSLYFHVFVCQHRRESTNLITGIVCVSSKGSIKWRNKMCHWLPLCKKQTDNIFFIFVSFSLFLLSASAIPNSFPLHLSPLPENFSHPPHCQLNTPLSRIQTSWSSLQILCSPSLDWRLSLIVSTSSNIWVLKLRAGWPTRTSEMSRRR